MYFCYFYDGNLETLITEDPEDFCCGVAKNIVEYYELEKENLSDEWFKDSYSYNDLQFNFNLVLLTK